MDYNLSIKLTAINNATAQINSVAGAVNNVNSAAQKAAAGGVSNLSKTLQSTGSRINVLGQRLTWMVSVPLFLFGKAAIDTAMEVETSWVRFRKVFNGTEEDINSLKKVAANLSNTFGRPIEEISEIMTEFNKAGVSSVSELEKLGKTVAQTAIIFDTDMKTALDGTKSVMMGFNLTADETEKALAAINIIADKTTASETGILDVFNRAAGTARQAGFSFRELAASQSVFEKNAIPAGRAGNAMKSILTSLTKQSNKAKDEFRALGVDMDSTAWRTANAGDKLNILSKKMLEVKNSQDKMKIADLNEAMASLVGKFQINNLNVLLEDMAFQFDNNADTISQFNLGLQVSADETENLRFQNQQLQKVMESSPQKIAIMNQMYRNQQVILGNELLPIKMKLLEIITTLITKFNELSPTTQKWIIAIGGILVVLGPLLSLIGLATTGLGFLWGAISTVSSGFGTLATSIGTTMGASTGLAAFLSGGLILAFAAVTAYLVTKAVFAVLDFKAAMDDMRKSSEDTRKKLDEMQTLLGTFSTEKANTQYKNSIDKANELWKANDELQKKYAGWPGVWNAFKDGFENLSVSLTDKFLDAAEKVEKTRKAFLKALGDKGADAGDWIKDKLNFANGGIVQHKANGGLIYAANGFLSKGRDTVPAMLSPGEMVLNKSQQSTMFDMLSGRTQMQNAGGISVNINVGTMVASRGEQREFARKITELLNENNNRG
jgi:TP901 family phage tail tape measure protein